MFRKQKQKSYSLGILIGGICFVAVAGVVAFSMRGPSALALGSQLPTVGKPSEPVVAEQSQFEITENDSGKTYTFVLGSHFGVFLDEPSHPRKSLSCAPSNIIAPEAEDLVVTKPLWGVRFYAVGVGACILRDKDFSMKILVQDN